MHLTRAEVQDSRNTRQSNLDQCETRATPANEPRPCYSTIMRDRTCYGNKFYSMSPLRIQILALKANVSRKKANVSSSDLNSKLLEHVIWQVRLLEIAKNSYFTIPGTLKILDSGNLEQYQQRIKINIHLKNDKSAFECSVTHWMSRSPFMGDMSPSCVTWLATRCTPASAPHCNTLQHTATHCSTLQNKKET